ncbi:GIY-YIG nuclease family protein [Bacteroides thetaiotaomicron]|uniref:GIY-YIG nuclease family protein n=1 Tax=Bacteroides thetaiotaomicron TaxID=818 RepID=A0A6I0S4P7_BACT4|nr:GIY-YIG nuclease family protein [Bacteroides thetaiotaomicron]KAB4460422.1 GIY-YIG nuclease family protein [Bacteroides thetaiotaomicron]KAB4469513.1 GIY-YIG nuclease family protein [Bacteroides thetaiotaomicron]KAB4469602.1 GIY-YIG nuclease family protein [Bacteroides thetaiotaomicron]KAB4481038.1 GIY-YIG nuclease family protein [Bacteroides thetaiotaomicron]
MEGYVYIMTNASMPGLLKIGCTTRSPEIRRRELSRSSGIPKDFEIEYEIFSPNMNLLEAKVHHILSPHRVNCKREFFKYNIDKAIDVIRTLSAEIVLDYFYKFSGVNETFDSYEAIDILGALKQKYFNLVSTGIISVRMYQTKLRCYLEIVKERLICQYEENRAPLIDQNIHRIDLGFIAYGEDDIMFDPSKPVSRNAKLFIDEFDIISIANCCSELLIDKAYENMYSDA